MATLNLFPNRIKFVNPDLTLTPEAHRALAVVQERVGGVTGNGVLPAVVLVVGASPFSFTAEQSGSLIVQGGTVTNVSYARTGAAIDLALLNGKFEMQSGDKMTVTYAVAPVLTFLPN